MQSDSIRYDLLKEFTKSEFNKVVNDLDLAHVSKKLQAKCNDFLLNNYGITDHKLYPKIIIGYLPVSVGLFSCQSDARTGEYISSTIKLDRNNLIANLILQDYDEILDTLYHETIHAGNCILGRDWDDDDKDFVSDLAKFNVTSGHLNPQTLHYKVFQYKKDVTILDTISGTEVEVVGKTVPLEYSAKHSDNKKYANDNYKIKIIKPSEDGTYVAMNVARKDLMKKEGAL